VGDGQAYDAGADDRDLHQSIVAGSGQWTVVEADLPVGDDGRGCDRRKFTEFVLSNTSPGVSGEETRLADIGNYVRHEAV
jgi:hypothetical protein